MKMFTLNNFYVVFSQGCSFFFNLSLVYVFIKLNHILRLLNKFYAFKALLSSVCAPFTYVAFSSSPLIVGLLEQDSGVAFSDLRVRPEYSCAMIAGERIGGIWDNEIVTPEEPKQV